MLLLGGDDDLRRWSRKGVKQLNAERRSFTLLKVGWASGAGGRFRHVRVNKSTFQTGTDVKYLHVVQGTDHILIIAVQLRERIV